MTNHKLPSGGSVRMYKDGTIRICCKWGRVVYLTASDVERLTAILWAEVAAKYQKEGGR